jgi:hypothetical protein
MTGEMPRTGNDDERLICSLSLRCAAVCYRLHGDSGESGRMGPMSDAIVNE